MPLARMRASVQVGPAVLAMWGILVTAGARRMLGLRVVPWLQVKGELLAMTGHRMMLLTRARLRARATVAIWARSTVWTTVAAPVKSASWVRATIRVQSAVRAMLRRRVVLVARGTFLVVSVAWGMMGRSATPGAWTDSEERRRPVVLTLVVARTSLAARARLETSV